MHRLFPLTVFLSAVLLFLAQPLIGKQVVPWFGGSAGVWTVCLAFFQLVLLLGYLYADRLSRLTLRTQVLVHAGALLAAAASLPIAADAALKPAAENDPTMRLMFLLAGTIGPTYFVLSTTGPLIQSWFAASTPPNDPRRARVYRLFALSNLASLLALVAYPFAIEPFLTVGWQIGIWSTAFVAFALLCTASAIAAVRAHGHVVIEPSASRGVYQVNAAPAPRAGRRVLWFLHSALGCALLVLVSTHITQNVASAPFLWILPLALYLLTFILCFDSAHWYRRDLFIPFVLAMLPAMAWGLSASDTVLHFWYAVPLYGMGLFVVCMFCHGELALARPAPEYLTDFYLMVASGGATGGLLVALAAPHAFDGFWELPLVLVLTAVMLFVVMRDRSRPTLGLSIVVTLAFAAALTWIVWLRDASPFSTAASQNMALAFLVATLMLLFVRVSGSRQGAMALMGLFSAVVTASLGWHYQTVYTRDVIAMDRNFYGTVRVRQSPDGSERRLHHGVILHGQQFLDDARRSWPTTYYSQTSGAGVAMAALREELGRPLKVGVVGLGVGTLAAWGEPGDQLRFYEINPQVVALAQSHFSYLSDSKAVVSTALGDARLVLAGESPQDFDLIVVDAFSSDAVPVHLITKEAMAVYARQLAPGGIVAFHVTNRYLELAPVVAGIARANGMQAVSVVDRPEIPHLERTTYVLASVEPRRLLLQPIANRAKPIALAEGTRPWTDDYNNLLAAFRR
ncbi:MAG: fused MFS/spermidine synthase [Nitrospiraceae bacterium]|nr:fused MFS/spermidine synthase [Nitrospiraceae bacterium]